MSGWGGGGANKALIDQVKEWQRKGPGHKKAWDNYCHENGHAKLDPSLKDDSFLQGFLDGTSSGFIVPTEDTRPFSAAGGGGGPEGLVDQVKSIQRQGQGWQKAWHKFCTDRGSKDFDPRRHDERMLQMFLSLVKSGAIRQEDDAQGGGGGGGVGKGGGGDWWGGGDDWWGAGGGDWWDPYGMISMLKGMKGGCGKGASDAILAGDWICQACGDHQFARNTVCRSCGAPKPEGAEMIPGGGGVAVGEIRFDDPEHCDQALETLDGSELQGATITLKKDIKSQDGTKLMVTGLPPGIHWQELKDHFATIGAVAYAGVKQHQPPLQFQPTLQQDGFGGGKGDRPHPYPAALELMRRGMKGVMKGGWGPY